MSFCTAVIAIFVLPAEVSCCAVIMSDFGLLCEMPFCIIIMTDLCRASCNTMLCCYYDSILSHVSLYLTAECILLADVLQARA